MLNKLTSRRRLDPRLWNLKKRAPLNESQGGTPGTPMANNVEVYERAPRRGHRGF
jgi:hypothetical protein